jgi:hypothetical protein
MSTNSKLAEVTDLMKRLDDGLQTAATSQDGLRTTLERLKVLGRDPKNAEPIYSQSGIKTLSRYALDYGTTPTSKEALRCIANALLLATKLRQIFVDLGCAPKAAERLNGADLDDEFLVGRILFLLTYKTKVDFQELFEEHGLGKSINANLQRHAEKAAESGPNSTLSPNDNIALSETLKLLFNLTNFYHPCITTFEPAVRSIFKILDAIKIPQPPLEVPMNYLINALINLNIDHHIATTDVAKLIHILDQATQKYEEPQLETLAVPLLTVLRRIHETASSEATKEMQTSLLPSEQERDLPLGQSDTLPSRLLRLTTSAVAPNLREAISSLIFELSDKDAHIFVRNVGYGYAAGYLMSHDIPVPASASASASDRTAEGGSGTVPINPVTGQRLDREPVGEMPEMSPAEMEREAERLFVLFERLRATGVVNVENPVRQAMAAGGLENRVEEVEDPD